MSPADEPPTSDVPYLRRLATGGRLPPATPLEVPPGVGYRTSDGPLTPVDAGEIGPLLRAGPAESALTKVARVFAIVRDLLIILLIVAALILGARVIQGVGDGLRGEPAATPCASPTADGFGSFCADTPGG